MLECNISRKTWEKRPFKGTPSWNVICKEKKKCHVSRPVPPTATSVKVSIQSLVNHTVDRILLDEGIKEHVKILKEKHGNVKLQLIYKIGLDGSKG